MTHEATEQPPAQHEDREPTERRGPVRDVPPVTERELAARARGLDSAYIPGGDDPELEKTKREEARWMRLLLLMVVVIVGGAMLVTFVGLIVSAGGGQ